MPTDAGIVTIEQSEPPPNPLTLAQVRHECKVCGNTPNEEGILQHGKGCYVVSEDGGGEEYFDAAATT